MRLAIVLLLALPAFSQDAKIMIVERSDSQKLAKAYREYKDALKRWEDVKTEIAKSYTTENGKVIPGWEKIQFSADFRALVPESSQYASHGWLCSGSLVTTTGANTISTPAGGVAAWSSADVNQDLIVKERQ